MANIKIYGTLLNDTKEPIAYASQIVDEETGKNVLELISDAASDANEYMTDEDADALVNSIFN